VNETERYLRRATRGLSGQARRDAQQELRGAIEDKVWRFTLLGMGQGEATQAALRDLGSPYAIASGLTRVHTLPRAALAALLATTAILLGVQALAQVPTVRAMPDPEYQSCVYDEAALQRASVEDAARWRLQLSRPGGRARLEAACRATTPSLGNTLLRLSDLTSALTRAGVRVRTPGRRLEGFLYLTFPGSSAEQTLDLSEYMREIAGESYVQTWSLINHLRRTPGVPVRLIGQVNPVLQLGETKIQLGTSAAPILATNLYAGALSDLLNLQPLTDAGTPLRTEWGFDVPGQAGSQIGVDAPDGTLFVVISNVAFTGPKLKAGAAYTFRIRIAEGGRITTPFTVKSLVDSTSGLVQTTARRQPTLLVYRLDTSDLRTLKLVPVPSSSLRLNP